MIFVPKSIISMIVKENQSIGALQNRFREEYPFLKIEFFKYPFVEENSRNSNFLLHPDQVIKDIRTIEGKSEFYINSDTSVQVVQQLFEEFFGLHVMIFRKAHDVWMSTTVTNYLTISMQNHKGAQTQAA